MTTLPETVLSPQLWTAATILGLLGAVIGLHGGRLVQLFGPVYEQNPPKARRTAQARNEHAAPPDDATHPNIGPEEASHNPEVLQEADESPPPPRCPHCLTALPFPAWTPLVATPRSACPHCERPTPTHTGTVLTTAALFALGGATPHPLPDLLPLLWLVTVGVPLATIDLRVTRLPNTLVGAAYPIAAILLTLATFWPTTEPRPDRAITALAGMALITALYWTLWRIHPRGMGFGDVKLSGLTGLYTAWAAGIPGALAATFWAFAAFSLTGLLLLALRKIHRTQPLPLGPFMLTTTLLTTLTEKPLYPL